MRFGIVGRSGLSSFLMFALGCSLDTQPRLLSREVPIEPVTPAPMAGSGAEAEGTAGSHPPAEPQGTPDAMNPGAGEAGAPSDVPDPGDPIADPNAGGAGTGPDMGAAGAAGAPDAPPTTGEPPMDPGSRNLWDLLQGLIAADPRVREAAAMRRILDAMGQPGGAPPDVTEALDALGEMNCWRNSDTCVAVCSWAVSNCGYCENDAACVAKLDENCRSSCR